MMNPIKVLVVDDSAFMRALIKDLLSNNKRIQVIGTARNGLDALDKIKRLNPDVVTLDVEMPVMDGIDALKKIMSESPLAGYYGFKYNDRRSKKYDSGHAIWCL